MPSGKLMTLELEFGWFFFQPEKKLREPQTPRLPAKHAIHFIPERPSQSFYELPGVCSLFLEKQGLFCSMLDGPEPFCLFLLSHKEKRARLPRPGFVSQRQQLQPGGSQTSHPAFPCLSFLICKAGWLTWPWELSHVKPLGQGKAHC